MSQRLRFPAWQVKSRTGFNGSTSDGPDSPVDPESVMDMSRQPGSWRMVETHNGRTDSQAKGIPSHRLCPGWNTSAPRGGISTVFWQVPHCHSQIFPVGIKSFI